MSPEDYNHPILAYIQPRTAIDPPSLMAVFGADKIVVPLTNAMLWQLLSQITEELRKIHAPQPKRVDY